MVIILEEIDPSYYKDFVYIETHGNKLMNPEAKKDI